VAIFVGAAPGYQTSSVSTAVTQVFYTSGTVNSVVIPSTFSSSSNFIIQNTGASTVYLGQSGVTTSTGLALAAGDSVTVLGPVFNVYGVVSSGTCSVESGLATLVVSE
jgi:hypothetical protein